MSFTKTLGVFTLASSIVLTGCSSLSAPTSSLDTGDDAKFFSSSGWSACAQGALAGGATGALIGQAIGKDSGSTAIGGIIGSAVGCMAGAGANYYFEQQRQNYAKTEDRLNNYIAATRENTEMLAQSTKKLQAVTAENNKLIAQISSQLKSGAIKQADAKKQLAKVDADIASAQKRLKKAKENYEQLVYAAEQDGSNKKVMAEIAKLDKQVKAYEKALDAQTSQRSAIQVG